MNTPKKELSPKEEVEQAVEDVKIAMIERVEAGQYFLEASKRQKKAHYTLQKAKERLDSLERSLK